MLSICDTEINRSINRYTICAVEIQILSRMGCRPVYDITVKKQVLFNFEVNFARNLQYMKPMKNAEVSFFVNVLQLYIKAA